MKYKGAAIQYDCHFMDKEKKILEAFGMNEGNITYRAGEISNTLKKSNIQKERR